MAVPKMRGSLSAVASAVALPVALAVVLCGVVSSARADEIRLKDGKKLYGVIVSYEDNMFKVKTDFGYVLVEKDKIASIVPSTPAGETPKNDKTPAAKKDPATDAAPKTEPAVASSAEGITPATNASVKSADPATGKREKTAPKITNAAVKPEVPTSTKTNAVAPAIGAPPATPAPSMAASAAQPAAPKEPEPPAIREDIQGNLYTNYTHGFKMYKAPSWTLMEDARKALPNAVVALGTLNQSTLLVIGDEESKAALDPAAATVEKRLSEIYENYKRISQRKTVVGGLPAIEYRYRGMADGHDWSGTLVVISRGADVFTVLGMTYADNDLIQIQENVISRSIASLDFNVH
jgi:molybdopterin-binding protein